MLSLGILTASHLGELDVQPSTASHLLQQLGTEEYSKRKLRSNNEMASDRGVGERAAPPSRTARACPSNLRGPLPIPMNENSATPQDTSIASIVQANKDEELFHLASGLHDC
jgi:hypothetical protein